MKKIICILVLLIVSAPVFSKNVIYFYPSVGVSAALVASDNSVTTLGHMTTSLTTGTDLKKDWGLSGRLGVMLPIRETVTVNDLTVESNYELNFGFNLGIDFWKKVFEGNKDFVSIQAGLFFENHISVYEVMGSGVFMQRTYIGPSLGLNVHIPINSSYLVLFTRTDISPIELRALYYSDESVNETNRILYIGLKSGLSFAFTY